MLFVDFTFENFFVEELFKCFLLFLLLLAEEFYPADFFSDLYDFLEEEYNFFLEELVFLFFCYEERPNFYYEVMFLRDYFKL